MPKRVYHADEKRPMDERDELVAEAMIALTNRLDLYEGDTVTDVTAKKADANHFGRVVVTFNE